MFLYNVDVVNPDVKTVDFVRNTRNKGNQSLNPNLQILTNYNTVYKLCL